ncbi:hypothetical protein TEGAF0_20080 [Sediminibacterium sp. TEGAF015]|nr:hypothetical protein TEGAF0_20080 [Sediminibacterium sp. TEGAF015]
MSGGELGFVNENKCLFALDARERLIAAYLAE